MSDVEEDVDTGNLVPAGTAKAVLEYLVESLVDDPDSVTIDVDEGRVIALRVRVAPDDMGRVIGRRGRVAQAIRTVVRAAGAGEGVDAQVDIVD